MDRAQAAQRLCAGRGVFCWTRPPRKKSRRSSCFWDTQKHVNPHGEWPSFVGKHHGTRHSCIARSQPGDPFGKGWRESWVVHLPMERTWQNVFFRFEPSLNQNVWNKIHPWIWKFGRKLNPWQLFENLKSDPKNRGKKNFWTVSFPGNSAGALRLGWWNSMTRTQRL